MNNKKIALFAVLALFVAIAAPVFASEADKASQKAAEGTTLDLDDPLINDALRNTALQLEEYAAAYNLLLPEGQSAELLVLYAVKTTYEEIPGDAGEPSGRPMYIDLDLVSRYSQANGGEPETNLVYLSLADGPEQEVFTGDRGEPSYSPSGLFLGELRKALNDATDEPVAWIKAKIRSLK